MNVIRFVDCNHPGVVYTGTEDHMRGLGLDGGCPSLVTGTSRIPDEDMAGGFWAEQMAPSHWLVTEAQAAEYLAWLNREPSREAEPCPLLHF